MQILSIAVSLLFLLSLACPLTARAFWWGDGDNRSELNLESGYDANTVTTITGKVLTTPVAGWQRHANFDLENGGIRMVVVLGPQRYWDDNGIALKVGDSVTVRGSKAEGKGGVVYILAQRVTDTTSNLEVLLRNESGRPAWSGGRVGGGFGGGANRPTQMRQQSPGRMGGGRMGR